jgi:hypothetical protein
MAFFDCPNVKLLGMWNWHVKAPQIAVSGISNFTFLRAQGDSGQSRTVGSLLHSVHDWRCTFAYQKALHRMPVIRNCLWRIVISPIILRNGQSLGEEQTSSLSVIARLNQIQYEILRHIMWEGLRQYGSSRRTW